MVTSSSRSVVVALLTTLACPLMLGQFCICLAPAPPPDVDGDGVTDSSDGCPNDPNKTEPGNCGCGHPESFAPVPLPRIAGGYGHSLVVKFDGTVWAWGDNYSSQLGDGTSRNSRTTPVQAVGLTGVVGISAGHEYSLAVESDGTVWAWGGNWSGQLGDGTTDSRTTPVQVSELTCVVRIAACEAYSLAVKSDGTAWAWGSDNYRSIGVNRPTPIPELSNVVGIAAGAEHGVAVESDGRVWLWGRYKSIHWIVSDCPYASSACFKDFLRSPTPMQVSGVTGVVEIAAGKDHDLAIDSDGTVWAWGSNETGALGDGETLGFRTSPVQVSELTSVVGVAAGDSHSLAVKSDGTAWAWGASESGQLGNGTRDYYGPMPVQVQGLTDVVAIAAGSEHSLAVKSDGTVWAWGNNRGGQLGDGTSGNYRTTPVQVVGLTGVVGISAGGWSSWAVNKSDGTVWELKGSSEFVQVQGLTDVVAIAAGSDHSLAVKSDGTVWAWGSNHHGQLGDGTKDDRSTPVPVLGLTGAVGVAAGWTVINDWTGWFFGGHSLAVTSDGTVWGWGSDDRGQLGDVCCGGLDEDLSVVTPGQVLSLTSVVRIAAGYVHSLAVESDGTVWEFGTLVGYYGTSFLVANPRQVPGLTSIVGVAAGQGHNLAVRADGTVWAWGINERGQLGNGTTTGFRITPMPVTGLIGAVGTAVGGTAQP